MWVPLLVGVVAGASLLGVGPFLPMAGTFAVGGPLLAGAAAALIWRKNAGDWVQEAADDARVSELQANSAEHAILSAALKAAGDRPSASVARRLGRQHQRLKDAASGRLTFQIDPDLAARLRPLHDAAMHALQQSLRLAHAADEVHTPKIRQRLLNHRRSIVSDARDATEQLAESIDHAHALFVERSVRSAEQLTPAREEAQRQLEASLTLAKSIEDRLRSFDAELQGRVRVEA